MDEFRTDKARRIFHSTIKAGDERMSIGLYDDGDVMIKTGDDEIVLEPTHLATLARRLEDNSLPGDTWADLGTDRIDVPVRAAESKGELDLLRGSDSETEETVTLSHEQREAFEEFLDEFAWVYTGPN